MDIFNYDQITGEYLSTAVADLDPLDNLPLIPAYATDVTVITPTAGSVATFNGTVWSEIEDHRGATVYDTTTKEESTISELGVIPADKTEIAPDEYTTWNGSAWVVDLPTAKTSEKDSVDGLAENQRQTFITNGSGQSMTYQQKATEADAYITAGSPVDLTPYPFVQAEVNATGNTATVAANDILAAQSAWIVKGAAIEELRIKAKIDIDAAVDMAAITVIMTAYEAAIVLV